METKKSNSNFDGSSQSLTNGNEIILPTELEKQKSEMQIADEKDVNYKRSAEGEKPEWEEWTLPSNRVARYKKLVGKDIRMATRIADGDQEKMGFALMVMALTINGQGITFEEFDAMDEDDVFSVMLRKANFMYGQKI